MVRWIRRISTRSLPIPRITLPALNRLGRAPTGPAIIHGGAHALYGRRQTDHDGFAHQKMPDVEFHRFGQPRDSTGGEINEPLAGMELSTEPSTERGAGSNAVALNLRPVPMPPRKRL